MVMKGTCKDISSLLCTPYVLYDMSRLLRRALMPSPTGIDRIDLQVARGLAQALGNRFLPIVRQGNTADLPCPRKARELIEHLWNLWRGDETRRARAIALAGSLNRRFMRVLPLGRPVSRLRAQLQGASATYVNCSHGGLLFTPGLLDKLRDALDMQAIIYIHDVIPLEYPEYSRPGIVERFQSMLHAAFALCPQILVNSEDTSRRLSAWQAANLPATERCPTHVMPPVIDWLPDKTGPGDMKVDQPKSPYFVMIGTIEPRKNHLLLLHLWRALAQSGEGRVPHLHIIGKRGWENENIIDMLERCEAIRPYVHEHNSMSQHDMIAMLMGARALLMPSFAEGLGLPLMEACQLGVPVIAADIPVFRELNLAGVTLVDPLDGPGWKRACLAAVDSGPARE